MCAYALLLYTNIQGQQYDSQDLYFPFVPNLSPLPPLYRTYLNSQLPSGGSGRSVRRDMMCRTVGSEQFRTILGVFSVLDVLLYASAACCRAYVSEAADCRQKGIGEKGRASWSSSQGTKCFVGTLQYLLAHR